MNLVLRRFAREKEEWSRWFGRGVEKVAAFAPGSKGRGGQARTSTSLVAERV